MRRLKKAAEPRLPDLLAGEPLPPPPCQKRSTENRARLKRAALSLFATKGYERTSIGEIAGLAKLATGAFYLHFRSKRQLLLVLMTELVEILSALDLRLSGRRDVRGKLRDLLSRAFSADLQYLGAYRAWQEAILTDADLARKQWAIQEWTTARVRAFFAELQQMPGARRDVDVDALARVMDTFFWSLLAQALQLPKPEIDQWLDSSTHLIYHALFRDGSRKAGHT